MFEMLHGIHKTQILFSIIKYRPPLGLTHIGLEASNYDVLFILKMNLEEVVGSGPRGGRNFSHGKLSKIDLKITYK